MKQHHVVIETIRLNGGYATLGWLNQHPPIAGSMGILVQPRTKGGGHGSTSRAFYARPAFVAHIINLHRWAILPPTVPQEP